MFSTMTSKKGCQFSQFRHPALNWKSKHAEKKNPELWISGSILNKARWFDSPEPYAVGYPWAMVVHSKHARTAPGKTARFAICAHFNGWQDDLLVLREWGQGMIVTVVMVTHLPLRWGPTGQIWAGTTVIVYNPRFCWSPRLIHPTQTASSMWHFRSRGPFHSGGTCTHDNDDLTTSTAGRQLALRNQLRSRHLSGLYLKRFHKAITVSKNV